MMSIPLVLDYASRDIEKEREERKKREGERTMSFLFV
jgi:hypothetical protein